MPQETMQDIENEQRARVARATRYDQLKAMVATNQTQVERFESEGASVSAHVKALERIIAEANKLPDDIHHDGIGLAGGCAIPNGVSKLVIVSVARSAW